MGASQLLRGQLVLSISVAPRRACRTVEYADKSPISEM